MQTNLNPTIVNYIVNARRFQSRYEIDKYLINSDYDPTEIEFAWLYVEQPKLADNFLKRKSRAKNKDRTSLILTIAISGFVIALLGLILYNDAYSYPWELDGDYSHVIEVPIYAVVLMVIGVAMMGVSLIISYPLLRKK